MIDAKTSHCAKTLKYLHENLIDIFPDITSPGEYGIHFINTNGRCEKRKTSWFNIAEVQQVNFNKNMKNQINFYSYFQLV